MSSLMWHWHRLSKPGRLKGDLFPGVNLGFADLCWCRGHWFDATAKKITDEALKRKEETR